MYAHQYLHPKQFVNNVDNVSKSSLPQGFVSSRSLTLSSTLRSFFLTIAQWSFNELAAISGCIHAIPSLIVHCRAIKQDTDKAMDLVRLHRLSFRSLSEGFHMTWAAHCFSIFTRMLLGTGVLKQCFKHGREIDVSGRRLKWQNLYTFDALTAQKVHMSGYFL